MNKLWIVAIAMIGCKPAPPVNQGEDMLRFFPFEQNKDCKWDFAHEDTLLEHSMSAEVTNFEFQDGIDYFEVTFVKECRGASPTCVEGELIRKMYWTVRGGLGIKLEGMDTPGATYTFDPPIQFADRYMKRGSVTESSTGGATYTSTLVEFGDCPVSLATFDRCAKFELTSADGGVDEVLGTYWAINSFNIVAIDWPDQNGMWQLVRHELVE